MMSRLYSPPVATPLMAHAARAARSTGLIAAFTLYVALAAAATIIYPPAGIAFLIPLALAIIAAAPKGKAVPRRLVMALMLAAAFLLPVWPVYLHVQFGPLPIMTPPRLVLYVLTGLWAYDMTFSPLRRGQFICAVKNSRWITGFVFALFALGLLSLPMAEGRSYSIPDFFRQVMIWLLPYCVVLTYVRRQRDFVLLLKVLAAGAFVVGLIAVAEAASRHLMAGVLSPFISDDAEWLRQAQIQKIRDGVFRAQASHTHPLSLGEHLAFSAPLALGFAMAARGLRGRLLWSAALVTILLGALATNSRGAVLVTAISLAAAAALLAQRRLRQARATKYRPLAGLAILCCVVASPVLIAGGYGVISGKGGESAANSTQSRVDQIEMAWPKILKRPVGGYGVGRSARVLGYWGRTLTIDNYYLSLALELGLPGPLAFLGLMIAFAGSSLRRSRHVPSRLALVYVGCFSAACVIAISRTIISQTGNMAIIFFMLAAFAGAGVARPHRQVRTIS